YDTDAELAGRKIAIPLIDSALEASGGACHREISYARSLLGCKRKQYGSVIRELTAAHLIAANTFCAHLIALEAIKLHDDTIPVNAVEAKAERRRANRYFAERRLPDPTL